MADPAPHCYTESAVSAPAPEVPGGRVDGPVADCVLCGEPTEHPADLPGTPLCPVCAWQQAQRGACSG